MYVYLHIHTIRKCSYRKISCRRVRYRNIRLVQKVVPDLYRLVK